jgi:DNA-directed RNA polymerase subunit alpha
MRRILLSSIPGAKVTGVKVAGVSHEYSTLPGVKDSVIDIMLNLKELVVSKVDMGTVWLKLEKKKAGPVTAADIKVPAGVEILNKDLYITEIDKDGLEINIDIRIEKSTGYRSIEDLKADEDDVDLLLIDANFSPVLSVKYTVEKERYGKITNLDSLNIEIETT